MFKKTTNIFSGIFKLFILIFSGIILNACELQAQYTNNAAKNKNLNIPTDTSHLHNAAYLHTSYEIIEIPDDITVDTYASTTKFRALDGVTISVLNDGTIYKMSVQEAGVYKLDYNFLKSQLGISNLDAIDPRTIKIYGNGGGMLPEANAAVRSEDVVENAITIVGEEDGKFDPSDYILFYSAGASKWYFDANSKTFNKPKNIYDDNTYYFLKSGGVNGLRISKTDNPNVTNAYQTSTYDYHNRVEDDKINVLASTACNCTQGSGKVWVGDVFNSQANNRDYSSKFNFTNVVANTDAQLNFNFVAASNNSSNVAFNLGNQNFGTYISGADQNDPEVSKAYNGSIAQKFTMPSANLNAIVKFSGSGEALAWLDFLQLTFKRNLIYENTPLDFRDVLSIGKATAFNIKNAGAQLTLWNVTNILKPTEQTTTASNQGTSFNTSAQSALQEFILYDKNSALPTPKAIGVIPNQNLHGIANTQLIIVYPKVFKDAALKLQQQKIQFDKIPTALAEVNEVYNEFSSGAQDPAAIRDFARFLVKKDSALKYVLLFGDGSFDFKNLYDIGTNPPSNFIPVYETDESFSPIEAFPSDDFYGLLSDNEGVGLEGNLDIGIGRIPCKTLTEAMAVVNKIIHYETQSFGAWRNDVTFFCDNGDGNLHLNAMDGIAQTVVSNYKNLNADKLYMDAYKLEVSAGGSRVPTMNDAIFQKSVNGTLTMCYMGHGGSRGLAQERILMREDLAAWQNFDKLPLIVTATCQFTGYDNPKEVTAGETAILNSNGGAIALFSTVRLVEASSNEQLTSAVFNNIYQKKDNIPLRLGDIFKQAKNGSSTYTNGQKFTLIGDPSMRLNLPRYNVQLQNINNKSAKTFTDTIKALQKISLSGSVLDEQGAALSGFNGTVDCTLFDKTKDIRTLGQIDGSASTDFLLQNNILFKGSATVKSGVWNLDFTIPKDIDFNCGKSKLSFYATNNITDANGIFELSLCKTDNTTVSANAPTINLFLNDTNFKNGGSVGTSPKLIVQLTDDLGINVSGNSIGHDLTLTLDSSKASINLNKFYQASLDNSKNGIANYTLTNLALGNHTLSVKAWNLNDISSTAAVNFIVIDNPTVRIDSIFSFPNPFSESATFSANYGSEKTVSNVNLNIYDLKGALIKTFSQPVNTIGSGNIQFNWNSSNGTNNLDSGLYLFVFEFDTKDANKSIVTTRSSARRIVLVR